MESGVIRDSQISASSQWDGNHAARQARLHFKANGVKQGGWSSLRNDQNQWLQVDLQQTKKVTRIATQGRNRYSQWVTKYKLQYGDDGRNFKFYKRYGDHLDAVGFENKHLMTGPKGNSEFCFLETLNIEGRGETILAVSRRDSH